MYWKRFRCGSILSTALLFSVPLFAEDWSQFLGPHRDGSTTNTVSVLRIAAGPQKAWGRKVGHGFSGPVIADGHLILFHREGDQEVIESWEVASGKPQWRSAYPTHYVDDFGFDDGPRGSPCVTEGKVFTFGAEGRLTCTTLAEGREVWHVDTQSRFKSDKGFFGLASSPVVHRGLVMVNIGGPGAGVGAFRADSGEVAWKRTDDEAGYASPRCATIGTQDLALFFTRAGLISVDTASGSIAFQFPWRSRERNSVNAASPVVRGDEIFLTASYETGGVLLRVRDRKPTVVWSGDDSLSAHYATPVLVDGYLYGFHGRAESRPDFRCVEWATGKVMWNQERFGAGTVILAGDRPVALLESGELVVIKPSPMTFAPLARVQVLGTGTRSPFALGDGLLAARDPRQLVVIKVAE